MKQPTRVAIIGTTFPQYEQYCPNWVGMMDGLERLGIDHQFFTCRPQVRIDDIVEYAPDLIVYGLIDMVLKENWRHEIRTRLPNAKIVMWYGDYRLRQEKADMSEIDMMFISNDDQNEYYESVWAVPQCRYLPLGSKIYDLPYNPRHDITFLFIGAKMMGRFFRDRAHEITRYEAVGLKVIDGPSDRPELRSKVFQMMPSLYRSSKVTLDQSHFTNVLRYTSNRHWIITASGGFALTKRFPGCEENYPEGTRAYFDTYEESLDLLKYYLEHPNEREVIRLAGYEQAKMHTYDHRFTSMFKLLYA